MAKRSAKTNQPEIAEPESSEHFAYIAGYTEGGVPYGITWEEAAEIEARENEVTLKQPPPQKSPVSLEALVQEMTIAPDTANVYYKRSTGEFYMVSDEHLQFAEDDESLEEFADWEKEAIGEAAEIAFDYGNDFVALPSKYDIHEYEIMEEFCIDVTNAKIRNDLLRSISGKGAFRRFKDAIQRHSIRQEWFSFRDRRLKEIAKEWCEENALCWCE